MLSYGIIHVKPLFMKKHLLLPLAVISLSVGALIFNACQKETRETLTNQQEAGKKEPHQPIPKHCARPLLSDRSIDTHCSERSGCGLAYIPAYNRNRISWRVGTPCPGSPNWVGTTYYTIYKFNWITGQYNKLTSFSCTSANMWYANSVLSNSSTFIIISNNASTSFPVNIVEDTFGYLYDTVGNPLSYSDSWKFATGTTAGTVKCIERDDPPVDL